MTRCNNETQSLSTITHLSHVQEDCEVLCQLLCRHDYSQFERHLQALTEFYKQASSPNDFPSMYRVLTAIEKQVVLICDKRY